MTTLKIIVVLSVFTGSLIGLGWFYTSVIFGG